MALTVNLVAADHDAFLYDEMPKAPHERALAMEHVPSPEAAEAFAAWMRKADKITFAAGDRIVVLAEE